MAKKNNMLLKILTSNEVYTIDELKKKTFCENDEKLLENILCVVDLYLDNISKGMYNEKQFIINITKYLQLINKRGYFDYDSVKEKTVQVWDKLESMRFKKRPYLSAYDYYKSLKNNVYNVLKVSSNNNLSILMQIINNLHYEIEIEKIEQLMEQCNISSYKEMLGDLLRSMSHEFESYIKNNNSLSMKLLKEIFKYLLLFKNCYCEDINYKVFYNDLCSIENKIIKLNKNKQNQFLNKTIKRVKHIKDAILPIVNEEDIRNENKKRSMYNEMLYIKNQKLLKKYEIESCYEKGLLRDLDLNICIDQVDFTDQRVITIDDDKSPDLGDALYLEKQKDDSYVLYVHISNVSDVLKKNPLIDQEAMKRGTSIYLSDHQIDMLPSFISRDFSSLIKGTNKNVFTYIFHIDKDGNCLSSNFVKGLINVDTRFNYEQVDAIIKNSYYDQDMENMIKKYGRTCKCS